MEIFRFKKKNKVTYEINRLLSHLEENPVDAEMRVRLADLYLQVGDQQSATREYQRAGRQLGTEGLDFEAIAIYRRILSLDGLSLTKDSLALLQESDKLLSRARRIFEDVFEIKHQNEEPKEASEAYHQDNLERTGNSEEVEIPEPDDSEPVDIETLLVPSEDQGPPETFPDETSEEHPTEEETSLSMASRSDGSEGSDWDGREESTESLATLFSSLDKALNQKHIQDPVYEDEITLKTDSSCGEDRQSRQSDDDREIISPTHRTTASTGNSSPSDIPQDLVDEDLIDMLERQLEEIKVKKNLDGPSPLNGQRHQNGHRIKRS
ncbi:hypothetical protein GTO27_06915 [Candidatus Bathyarchaeota archaeon]|nr:hypothetical protein [Candidatus Bathyarchaeota archaeon]